MTSNRLGVICVFVVALTLGGCMTSYSNMKVNGKPVWVYVDSHDVFIVRNNIDDTVLKNIKGGGWQFRADDIPGLGTGEWIRMPIDPWYDIPRVELTADVHNLDGKFLGVARSTFSFWENRAKESRFGDPPKMWLVSQFDRVVSVDEAARISRSP